MILEKPQIFNQFPEIIFGLSTKFKTSQNDKFNFNMSKSIGDKDINVEENRRTFFESIGLSVNSVIVQKQIHSDIINVVDEYSSGLVGDALITRKSNLGLAVSTADCTNIYLYDSGKKIIAAVHSGWAGTEKRILEKTLIRMKTEFSCNPKNIYCYFGPSICQLNYEVGDEFKAKFDAKYLIPKNGKYLLDLKSANKHMLINYGIPNNQIEDSEICSFENEKFHSYRRDKDYSGRALGVIAINGI
ncbi:MAG: peptidoglycan editing factor PgeF [Ignavibacteriales bacterium]|nr:peptidoglycan editing factor PgeF [Ignavibacteriales bacterium]